MTPQPPPTQPAAASSVPGESTAGSLSSPRDVQDVIAAGVLLDVSRVLGDLLALARPSLGARTERITRLVRAVVRDLDLAFPWEFEVAARLSQVGWLALPPGTHEAAWRGDSLSEEEWFAVASHPLVARDLLANVGRLGGVREMIARQCEPFALERQPPSLLTDRDRIVLGGQILRVCGEYVALLERGLDSDQALRWLASEPLERDSALVAVVSRCTTEGRSPDLTARRAAALQD